MAVPMSASERAKTDAWNASVTDRQKNPQNYNSYEPEKWSLAYGVGKPRTDASAAGTGQYVTGSNGQQYEKLAQGYRNTATGETVSGISTPGKNNVSYGGGYGGGGGGYSFGGGSGGGGGMQTSAAKPIEFFLGAAPTIENLDLTSPISNFRNTFNQLNSGVNPNFFVDQQKIASDAKSVAAKLNMSPEQIKAFVAGVNPTTGELIADAKQISDTFNNPGEIAAKAGAIANSLNKKYQDEFESAMPGYKANMQAANNLTGTYLAGKIPQDVVDQIFRNSAAKGFTTGLLGGGIGRNIVARDLGLTSLQLQTAGANLLQQTANIANSVLQSTMPVTGEALASRFITDPGQIFSSVASMKRVDPTSIFNAVYTPTSQVYNQMASMAQQSTMARANFEASKMIAPSQVFDVLTTQAQYNQQINAANALNAWQSQPLPGQFDIKKGQYVGLEPGTYSSTRPMNPKVPQQTVDQLLGPPPVRPKPPSTGSGDYNTSMGMLGYYENQVRNYNLQMAARKQKEIELGFANPDTPIAGAAYRPQLTGFGA